MPHHEEHDHDHHDEITEDGYKKRCYCQKCTKKYDEWCREHKDEGHTSCKRRCYTVCEVICEKPVTTVTHWGYKKEFEGKWEKYHDKKVPAKCSECKRSRCRCNRA